jgi:hypothetical protein
LLLIRCNDDPIGLGLGILPEGDILALSSVDSLPIKGENAYPYELFPNGDIAMIGTQRDSIFGILRTSLLTEFRPVKNELFPVPPSGLKIADTLKIYLRWMNSILNSSNENVNMQVFLLKDTLSSSIRYHRGNFNITDFIDPTPIAEKSVNLSEQDSIITIQLPQSYADALASIDSIDYLDNVKFRNAINRIHLNGFYIKTTDAQGQGTIATFIFNDPARNPVDSVSYNLLFTYHTQNNPTRKDFWFTFSSYANEFQSNNKKIYLFPKINVIEHDYSSTKFYSGLNGVAGDTLLYVQGIYGVRAKVDMSVLDSFVNKNRNNVIDVAKAELIVPSDTTLFYTGNSRISSTITPSKLSLGVPIQYNNYNIVVPYSGYYKPYNEVGVGGQWNRKAYVFNISEYVQEYLNGQTKQKELFIQVPSSDFRLEGVNLKQSKIKLNIKYSTFKNK